AALSTRRRLEELLRSMTDAVEKCTKVTTVDIQCDHFRWIRDATKLVAVEHKIQADRAAVSPDRRTGNSSCFGSADDEGPSEREYIQRHVVPHLTRAVRLCEEELLRNAATPSDPPVNSDQQMAFIAAALKGAI
ncbi:hypothetical protein FOZ63_008791, partial [Perkinsus olseni]